MLDTFPARPGRYVRTLTARLTATPPTKEGSARKHCYHYDVEVDGEVLVTNSWDPEHDLARVLLTRGIVGQVKMLDGKTGKHRTTVNIEKAAKYSVYDGDKGLTLVKFKPWTGVQT